MLEGEREDRLDARQQLAIIEIVPVGAIVVTVEFRSGRSFGVDRQAQFGNGPRSFRELRRLIVRLLLHEGHQPVGENRSPPGCRRGCHGEEQVRPAHEAEADSRVDFTVASISGSGYGFISITSSRKRTASRTTRFHLVPVDRPVPVLTRRANFETLSEPKLQASFGKRGCFAAVWAINPLLTSYELEWFLEVENAFFSLARATWKRRRNVSYMACESTSRRAGVACSAWPC